MVFLGTGILAATLFFVFPGEPGSTKNAVLVIYALTAIIFGTVSAVARHRDVQAQLGLARGDDLLARWQVDLYTWRDFIALNEKLQAESQGPDNELIVSNAPPAGDVAIVIGKTAIDIDGQLFVLPRRGVPEITDARLHESRVHPSYLELHLKYPGGGTGASGVPHPPRYTVLRFPVPMSGLREAQVVAAHYNGDTPGTADFFHGTGDGTNREDLSTCWSCGFETHKYRSQCPNCGSSLQSRRWSRRFGLLLTLCGVFLTGLMSVVLYKIGPMLRHPGVEINGTRFSGSAGQALLVLLVLSAVFVFGATALGYGAWQMATGRRNKKVLYVMVGIFAALAVVAEII